MKHAILRGLLGSLLVLSCSSAFSGGAMSLELTRGDASKLSGYTANGTLNARSAYAGAQADPLALSDFSAAVPSVDTTQAGASAESSDTQTVWVNIQGTVRNDYWDLVCAMALANGQYTFTCNPLGVYGLTVPLNSQGQIDLQVFAAGHMPFRQKLPSNQGFYGVILETAADCSTPPPTTYDITINLIDQCNDGLNIDYKYYDTINSWVWPSSTTHWETPGYGLYSTRTLNCQAGGNVCLGARADTRWWGLDLDGSDSCTDCCVPCENETWDWTLPCD